ncbi:MAG: hypothetical protein E5W34_04380 [Mesorhizobium sp.]|nr:MAG: hypothetical protein E5W34_04380 [Mesorhizobium sp.]
MAYADTPLRTGFADGRWPIGELARKGGSCRPAVGLLVLGAIIPDLDQVVAVNRRPPAPLGPILRHCSPG